jgi:hypothetical protein
MLKFLDSRFRGNDGIWKAVNFCGVIHIPLWGAFRKPRPLGADSLVLSLSFFAFNFAQLFVTSEVARD